jgi:membrane fusion protein (multidrug efflux system)
MISSEELDATRRRHESAAVGVERAEITLAHTVIHAPIAGVVTRRLVEQGDLVQANQEICEIADLDLFLAKVFIPERQIFQITADQSAKVTLEAVPGETFTARIRMVSPQVDAESGTVKVTLEVAGSERLKPGMFATVRLITGRRPRTLVIHKAALVLETEEEDVIAIVDSRSKRLPVELGLMEGDRVEVLSGISEGDMLVTVGHNGLQEGTLLRVVGPAANTAGTTEAP